MNPTVFHTPIPGNSDMCESLRIHCFKTKETRQPLVKLTGQELTVQSIFVVERVSGTHQELSAPLSLSWAADPWTLCITA